MLITLWGSWFVLYLIARMVGVLSTLAVIEIVAWLPGDRANRLQRLMANNGRGFFTAVLVGFLLALVVIGYLSRWWFVTIAFQPVWVAVFGSVGIAALTWALNFYHNRGTFMQRLHDEQQK